MKLVRILHGNQLNDLLYSFNKFKAKQKIHFSASVTVTNRNCSQNLVYCTFFKIQKCSLLTYRLPLSRLNFFPLPYYLIVMSQDPFTHWVDRELKCLWCRSTGYFGNLLF